jgi:MSHA pilin protein MshD
MSVPPPVRDNKRAAMHGFTLIELVVGITLVAIAATLLVNLIVPAWRQSAEPLVQQRAASLAQSLMDEILSKRYDETTPDGGVPRCDPCTVSLGAESGESRATFDDVDDYNAYCGSDVPVQDTNGDAIGGYDSYLMRICVSYDSAYNGGNAGTDAKRITVTITPSANVPIIFTAYRANF